MGDLYLGRWGGATAEDGVHVLEPPLVTCMGMNCVRRMRQTAGPCYYGGHLFLCKLDFG